jgi:hypothetical protein
MTARRAVLVLGMHRSGTSAVAGVLAHCGLQAPITPMAADQFNAAGYWESSVFEEFHDRILLSAGSRWDACTRIDFSRLRPETAARFRDECRVLLEQEFGAASSFVLKDPRICRLLPFWLDVLETASVTVSPVIVLRNPFEVAASLAARDGLSPGASLLMWLRHVLDAESETRSLTRAFLAYDDVLANWRAAIVRLAHDLTAPWLEVPEQAAVIDAFVREDLRHHRSTRVIENIPPVLLRWVEQTRTALEGLLARNPDRHVEARCALDAVRQEFDALVDTCCIGSEQRRMDLERRLIDAEQHRASAEQQILNLQTQLTELEQARERLAHHSTALEHDRASLRADRDALLSSWSWRVTAPLRRLFGGSR